MPEKITGSLPCCVFTIAHTSSGHLASFLTGAIDLKLPNECFKDRKQPLLIVLILSYFTALLHLQLPLLTPSPTVSCVGALLQRDCDQFVPVSLRFAFFFFLIMDVMCIART